MFESMLKSVRMDEMNNSKKEKKKARAKNTRNHKESFDMRIF